MRREGSLRGRIAAAYVWLALAVCGFFAMVAWFAVGEVERYLVERRLESLVEWQLRRSEAATDLPRGLEFHVGAAIPGSLVPLGPGFHEVVDESHNWYVLLGTRADGTRFAAIDEIGDWERIEREVMLGLAAGMVLLALLAAWLGRISSGLVIRPLTELAEAVAHDALREDTPALAHDDEIGVLARAFAARSAEQRHFLARERLFTGDVSHELRTPLTVILGAAEVLAVRLRANPELLAAAERIERTAKETSARVAALLLLSRAPDRIDAPRVALRPLLEQEAERCRPQLAGKPVTLEIDAPDEVWAFGRAELIGTAVGNLMRNACQYTEAGRVSVRLRPGSITVDDSGPGVPLAVREHLFERLVRDTDNPGQGAGLGLAIAARIVEHLGWEIELESLQGRAGSRFVLRFPSEAGAIFTPS